MKISGLMATTFSGSAGGITAGNARGGGQFIRRRAIPTNPRTNRQEAVRQALAAAVVAWNSELTEPQREAWRAYSANTLVADALGNQIQVGPMGMFIRSAVPRLQDGQDIVLSGPTVFNLGDPPTIQAASLSVGTGVTLEFGAEVEDGRTHVQMGRPQNAGINFFAGPWRFVDSTDEVDPNYVTAALPFAFAVGQAVWFRVRNVYDDGRVSSAQQIRVVAGV